MDQDSEIDRRAVLGAGAALAGALWAANAQAQDASGPIAHTAQGAVRGYDDQGVKVFKGIPYGAPTGGDRRWLAPAKPQPWTGVRPATEYGPMSVQVFGAPMAEETAVLQRGPMSEDCLNLNVWTPAVGGQSGQRPVMVWFHGGAFAGGSGGAVTYDGVNLCSKQDVVLVTVSHRLNAFGFLYLADVDPSLADSGNAGILDCVAALEWVRDNIAGFGGDPGNVTIFGQSGGGSKVLTLMAMPAAKGLFHRAIAESGLNIRALRPAQAIALRDQILARLGLKASQVAELRALPADKLEAAVGPVAYALGPVVDGRSLEHDPFDPGAPKESAGVPLILGSTETEAVFFPNTPLGALDDAALAGAVKGSARLDDAQAAELIGLYRAEYSGIDNTTLFQILASDVWMTADVSMVAERKAAQGGAPAYVYYFTQRTSVRGGVLKTPHTLEIPYVFDNLKRGEPIIGPVTAAEQVLADRLSRTWATFARTGNPNNPGIPTWQAYDAESRPVLRIEDHIELTHNLHRQTIAAIRRIKEKQAAQA